MRFVRAKKIEKLGIKKPGLSKKPGLFIFITDL